MPRCFLLPPAVGIYCTDSGLIVRHARTIRLDLGNRAFEARLVEHLQKDGDLEPLYADYTKESVDRAVVELVGLGALVPDAPKTPIVDLLGKAAPGEPEVLHGRLIVIARPGDPRIGAHLERARVAGVHTLLIWTVPGVVTFVHDDPEARPCARCALLFDARAHELAAPRALVAPLAAAMESGRYLTGEERGVALLAASIAVSKQAADARWPPPGEATWIDAADWSSRREGFKAHPGCACVAAADKGATVDAPPTLQWASLCDRRFSPLISRSDGANGGLARVLFRRGRSPWPLAAADYGAATAGGADAKVRALGEGIERFGMLHAPPDVRAQRATGLGEAVLDEAAIRSLLFRKVERSASGFRLDDYDPTAVDDWCWATSMGDGARRLVPASLAGRTVPGGRRLVDGSSNGYAAHTDLNRARDNAVLELIERDAVLWRWYLGGATPRIDTRGATELRGIDAEIATFVATLDVDLPVVWLLARLPDGSARSAAAAALDFDEAFAKAASELSASVSRAVPRVPPGEPPLDLAAVGRHHGPTDHLRYYRDPEQCGPVVERMQIPPDLRLQDIRRRWKGACIDAALAQAGLRGWFVDRSLPRLFGDGWFVTRALVPGLAELSWGLGYRRVAGARATRLIARTDGLNPWPHPIS